MLGDDFITTAIEEEMIEGGKLEDVKNLLNSSFFVVEPYPSVIIEEDPNGFFDFSQLTDDAEVFGTVEHYNVAVHIKSKNFNDVKNPEFRDLKKSLFELSKKIVKVISKRGDTFNDIVGVTFGKGDITPLFINSVPVLQMIIPCEVTVTDF